MEPADAPREEARPVEVARLQERAGLVRAVVKDHRRPDPLASVAIDGGDVRTTDAVVVEPLVEGCHPGFANPRLHQFADRVFDHRRRDARLETEAVRQVGGDVVLAARDVDLNRPRFAKRDDPRIEPMHQGAQGQEVQFAGVAPNVQTAHEETSNRR